jgi:site-specific DNA-methyltransferase (adenine-specific)
MSSAKDDWNTPDVVLDIVRRFGVIDLDPCSNSHSIVEAQSEHSEDGLGLAWRNYGLAFVNPPYGREIKKWVAKMRTEGEHGAEIIGLVPARPDTAWFSDIWKSARAICFWRGRITFLGAQYPAPFPSALPYWGPNRARFADTFQGHGYVVVL